MLISEHLLSPVSLRLYGAWMRARRQGKTSAAEFDSLAGTVEWSLVQSHVVELGEDDGGAVRFLRVGADVARIVGRDATGLSLQDAYGADANRFEAFNRAVLAGHILLAQERAHSAGPAALWFEVFAVPIQRAGRAGVLATTVVVAEEGRSRSAPVPEKGRVVILEPVDALGLDWTARSLPDWRGGRAKVAGQGG